MQTTGFRACESCRALKVKCMPADGDGSGGASTAGGSSSAPAVALPPVSERAPCRRCQDTGTTCIYTEPRRTKRKRTDVRVRELEREVRMLSELLMLRKRMNEEGIPATEYEGTAAARSTARATLAAAAAQTPPPAQQSLPDTPSALFMDSPAPSSQTDTRQTAMPPPPAPAVSRPHPQLRLPVSTVPPPPPPQPIDLTLHGPPRPETADPVAAGILSMDKATRLFRRYVTMMAPQRPFVVFPKVTLSSEEEMTPDVENAITVMAALVREHQPVLFLSVLTAALGTGLDGGPADSANSGSNSSSPDNFNYNSYSDSESANRALGTVLDALLLRVYADRIIYQSQKSLELVQALLISSNWNFYFFEKPNSQPAGMPSTSYNRENPSSGVSSFDHLRFYQHLHMAATMAIELESMRQDGTAETVGGPVVSGLLADPLAFERTMLACYMCCSSISLGFHRQAMLSFTPPMAEYLRRLETSPHAASTDAVMVAWVHLQRTVDMTAGALRLRAMVRNSNGATVTLADNTSNAYEDVPDLSDPSIQATLQDVTRQLEQWRRDHSRCMTNSLLIQYNTILCLLHESCFYNEFDPSDLKPPYRLSIPSPSSSAASSSSGAHLRSPMTQAHMTSRRICLMAARSLIGLFLSSPTEQLLGSPVVVYARLGYAVVVLLKLQISAALPGGAMHGIWVDTATGDSATQIYQYLESLIARLEELEALGGRIAAVWMSMVRITHAWYEAYFLPAVRGAPPPLLLHANPDIGPVLEPLRHCLLTSPAGQNLIGQPLDQKLKPGSEQLKQHPYSVTDQGYRELVSDFGTSVCSMLATMSAEEEEAFLSSALESGEIDRWMDPRIGLGDIQNQIFEFSAM
ncbi:hypothetical protein SEUCBS139899_004761 [Sporothrix eucalyptigena]|uniref:Zn(2)-C6 fungal-type domain-containing protein n=1 Tax=Sporothrix eucalyptigena TaxID=1812306 RepID=A0ABP0C3B4_9PEZI